MARRMDSRVWRKIRSWIEAGVHVETWLRMTSLLVERGVSGWAEWLRSSAEISRWLVFGMASH